jgi:protein-disulfide isomerase
MNGFRAALLSIAFTLLAGVAAAEEFTAEQRGEIEAIVRDYLLRNPEILLDVGRELEKRQQETEAKRAKGAIVEHAEEIFRSPADFVAGNPDGDVTIVEFFDYNCPWCKKSVPVLQNLMAADGSLRLVLKEFPILGEGSEYAARAAIAAIAQGKYLEFHMALYQHRGQIDAAAVEAVARAVGLDVEKLKADMEAPAVAATIARNRELAQALGINGTPGFVIDGEIVSGYVIERKLAETVQKIRDAGGCAVC